MSVRRNAPYRDRIADNGATLIYEGHDVPKSPGISDPKRIDQPEHTLKGALTQNGVFHGAAQDFKAGKREPERVRVYEKIRDGIWSYNGVFYLTDSWREQDSHRTVFKFRLISVEGEDDDEQPVQLSPIPRRIIPTEVKLEVWKRDGGRCIRCGATNELHFDHDLPFSKGGSSITAQNVQLLCARHNLEKHDQIE
jgi:hypothetical protein